MNLPKLLKAWRGVSKDCPRGKFNQPQAARKLGVKLRTYENWEQGRYCPEGLALTAVLERIK
jgi:hypothetical protein